YHKNDPNDAIMIATRLDKSLFHQSFLIDYTNIKNFPVHETAENYDQEISLLPTSPDYQINFYLIPRNQRNYLEQSDILASSTLKDQSIIKITPSKIV